MPYQPAYYRPPRIYAETQARRRRDAQRTLERKARKDGQRIAAAIEENGERMSDEGRGLLAGLAETLKGVAAFLGGRER